MTVINLMMKPLVYPLILLMIFGCMEPNTENLWTLNPVAKVETKGYCRDVFIIGDSVFVAAGQAGVQLWDISIITAPELIWEKSLSDLGVIKEISQVEYESEIQQLFALENNERPIHIDLSKGDTATVVGQFSSEKTKEFRVVTNSANSFTVYAADNDDGLKISTFEYDSSFGLWFNTVGDEIISVGNPNGIDMYENVIVLTLDQLGFEVFHNQNGVITSSYHIDLEGNARSVTMTSGEEMYVACEEAGAYGIWSGATIGDVETKTQFAKDLFVTHVAVNGDQIVISCASNGLALYKRESNKPADRGIHDIGYVYHTEFASGYLFAATREGLQIFEIEE